MQPFVRTPASFLGYMGRCKESWWVCNTPLRVKETRREAPQNSMPKMVTTSYAEHISTLRHSDPLEDALLCTLVSPGAGRTCAIMSLINLQRAFEFPFEFPVGAAVAAGSAPHRKAYLIPARHLNLGYDQTKVNEEMVSKPPRSGMMRGDAPGVRINVTGSSND